MAQNISENIKIDFKYYISSALQNKITWEALDHFLDDLTPTLATSKHVIKVLLKELQKLQSESQSKSDIIELPKETQAEDIIFDDIEVSDDTDGETEEFPSELIKVEDECLEQTNLDQQDDAISLFEINDIDEDISDDEYYDLANSSIDIESKRARLECLICVKTFRYRVQLNKHRKTHDVDEGIIDNDEMKNNDEEIVTNEPFTEKPNVTEASGIEFPKSLGFEVPSKPFFSSTWRATKRGNSKGGWVTALFIAPYQYSKQKNLPNGGVRFNCNSCKNKHKKSTWAYTNVTGYEQDGMPKYKLFDLLNDHVCQPESNGYTSFLNRVLLDR